MLKLQIADDSVSNYQLTPDVKEMRLCLILQLKYECLYVDSCILPRTSSYTTTA